MDATLRQMIESYIGSGLRGKAAPVSLDAIRDRAAQLVAQGVPRADIDAARVAAEEAAKAAYNVELRAAVDSVLNAWGTVNSKGSGQRVIRDFSNAADQVPVDTTGASDEQRLSWALQVLQGYKQSAYAFSKRAFGGWEAAVTPLTSIHAPAARIYPEWVPDYFVIDPETGWIGLGGPVDYTRWVPLARQLGFEGDPYTYSEDAAGLSAAFMSFVDTKRAQGFDFVAHRGNIQNYWQRTGFKLPDGRIVGESRARSDQDVIDLFTQFVLPVFTIAGGFAFVGSQIAGFTGIPSQYATGFLRAAVATAGGQDVDRALLSALGPVVIQDILPPTVWQAPDLGTIDPGLIGGDELLPSLPEPVVELLTAPELPPVLPPPVPVPLTTEMQLPPLLPPPPLPEPMVELLPPPELPPELLPPLNLPPALPPPTIEPTGAPTMDDFFTADDYAFPGGDGGFGFDFDTLDPIPTVDAGDWFVGPMPLPGFPAIEEDFFFGMPIEGTATEEDLQSLITVGDISTVTVDELANYTGTGGAGGIVETGGTGPGTTVIEVIKDATAAMVAALGLVQAYRALTSKPAPNPVVQARQGQNTIRANPDGTITTTAPNGQTRTARPPVGQPQMTTDGTMIVNNGDGTYTRIGRDGQSVVNRYPLDITERFGAAASSPYTLPLLLAGGAALVLFATRKR